MSGSALMLTVAVITVTLAADSAIAQQAGPANPFTRVSRWTPPPLAPGKKPFTQDSYDEWRSISGATLTNDGKWAVYTLSPVVGEGELVVRATGAGTEYRVPRGYTGRPQNQAGASGGGFNAAAAQINAQSTHVVFLIYPSREAVESVRGRRGARAPHNTMGILDLANGSVTRIENVQSFRLAKNGGRYLAYQLEDTTSNNRPGGAGGPGAGGGAGAGGAPAGAGGAPGGAPAAAPADSAKGPKRDYGNTVVLRELSSGQETRIEGVNSFEFDENENWLGYTVTTKDSVGNGAFVRSLGSGAVTTLLSGQATWRGFSFDEKGSQVALVTDFGDSTSLPTRFAVYYASLNPPKGKTVTSRRLVTSADVADGLLIAERGSLEFTKAGNALKFSLGVVPFDSIPADSLTDKAIYDLWHWQDAQTQPAQKLSAARDRNRTFTALYNLASNRWVQLANDSLRVVISDDGRRVLGINSLEYAIPQFWGEGASDAYLIDPATGARTLIGKRLRSNPQLSPGGNYVLWFEDNAWRAYAVATGKLVNLTEKLPVAFYDEEFDSPDIPPSYGLAGWTTDDKRVLVNDRFDVWEVDPTGAVEPRNLTANAGRRNGVTYRVVRLDRDDPFIDPGKPVMLRMVDTLTKASGYASTRFASAEAPTVLVRGERNYAGLQKARNAEQYLLTQSTYREFPDLWTGSDIAQTSKISNANPQDSEYPRGTVELVSWLNDDGVPLRGMLYKPEGFDASRKYPMVVYFYEKLSDGLFNYVAPTGRNVVNPLVYNSLGYVVFMPDIIYTDGQPGPSSAKAIIPGVQSLIQRGFIDPERIGITGQSWGGYETAFLVTVTNMFAAAVPNATVVNMTSAYGGIRWASGLARSFQYEHTQSRIGGSLWEYPERYIENSPLFRLDRVNTPVLFMANDNDGAVPWYQGIEFYVAMRRLQKEAYMVVYNGDEHNPTKRANQKDIDKKMQEFFAVKLMGADAPSWMVRGIPFLEKGQDQVKMTGTADQRPPNHPQDLPHPQD